MTETCFWQALYDNEPNKSKKIWTMYTVDFPLALYRIMFYMDTVQNAITSD